MNGPTPLVVVAAPVIGLAVACVTHLFLARVIRGRGPYPPLVLGIGAGAIASAACALRPLVGGPAPIADVVALQVLDGTAYLALAFGYFNFVNLSIASLRIRMLEEIRDAARPMSKTALLARYDTDRVVDVRIERLVRGGHLVDRDGRLVTGRRAFLVVARLFEALRMVILGPHATKPPLAPGGEAR